MCRSLSNLVRDIVLNQTLRVTVVGTIAVIAMIGLILCYQAIFELIGFDFPAAGMRLGWGAACAVAALLLIRYRNDLIDD